MIGDGFIRMWVKCWDCGCPCTTEETDNFPVKKLSDAHQTFRLMYLMVGKVVTQKKWVAIFQCDECIKVDLKAPTLIS